MATTLMSEFIPLEKQEVSDLTKKTLDKSDKMVYNIRKDAKGFYTFCNQLLNYRSGYTLTSELSENTFLEWLFIKNERIKKICDVGNLPYPTLAGGALRDLVFQRIPKDYDYFFTSPCLEDLYDQMDRFVYTARQLGWNISEGGGQDAYETDQDNFKDVFGVFNIGNTQAIFVHEEQSYEHCYDRFDQSICQLEANIETDEVTLSPMFIETLKSKTIQVYNSSDYTRKRVDRNIETTSFGVKYKKES